MRMTKKKFTSNFSCADYGIERFLQVDTPHTDINTKLRLIREVNFDVTVGAYNMIRQRMRQVNSTFFLCIESFLPA